MATFLPTVCGKVAHVSDTSVVVLTVEQARQFMAEYEGYHDRCLRDDPADAWGLAKGWKQDAQAIGEALLSLQGVSRRAA